MKEDSDHESEPEKWSSCGVSVKISVQMLRLFSDQKLRLFS
jgi:hypothetical protein